MNYEQLYKILFAGFLNQHGVNTGVDAEKLFKEYVEMEEKKDVPMEDYEDIVKKETDIDYSEIIDGNTAEIKHIVDEIIDRTGIVNHLEIILPKSCLTDIFKALDHIDENLRFQMNVYSNKVMLRFFNR